jgi:beta-lactamase regulating signal transducer with metallopeptidase domain/membrane-associated protease RseP (regulator of RpoE activity)
MAEPGVNWLLRTAVGGGLLLLLAWGAMRWASGPARCQRLAVWAVLAGLLTSGLSLAPAWLVVPLPQTACPEAVALLPAEKAKMSEEVSKSGAGGGREAAEVVGERETASQTAPGWVPEVLPPPDEPAPAPVARRIEEQEQEAAAPPPPAAPAEISLVVLALAAYACGSAVVLGRWLLGHFALGRLLRTAAAAPEPVARLFREMGGARLRARLLTSPRARVPFSCGVLRPTVVLPAALAARATPAALRWVFAHELDHLERRDARAGLVFQLGQVVYYYLPWFWWLRRQARLCQEYLADAAAARAGAAADYAQFLVGWSASPPPPVGATGVSGPRSDLFRRIAMLLHNPTPPEPRCPRRWSMLAAAGLLSAAVAAAGLGLGAHAAPVPAPRDEPKKEEPKKEDPKKVEPKKEEAKKAEPGAGDPFNPYSETIDNILKLLPEKMDPKQAELIRKQIEANRKEMEKVMQGFGPGGFGGPAFGGNMADFMAGRGLGQASRLGARVAKPSATLADQLDLPRDQGVVLEEVVKDSPAGKAGLKAHDILLELNGKPVPSRPEEVAKLVAEIKADKPVDAVVLRKGKRETVKGLTLPEVKAPEFGGFPGGNPFGGGPPPGAGFPPAGGVGFPGGGFGGAAAFGGAAGDGVLTTTFRSNDRFTTRHQEGSLVITVTGKVADGKATVSEIRVQDGRESHKYESADKVPEQYRDKVQNLVEMSEKGSVKIEIKKP